MLFYGLISLGLLLAMAGLAYFFPEYGLRLLNAASSKFWALLKPELFKRMPPDDEAEWRKLQNRGASQREINEWHRKRKRRKPQK